MARPVALAFSGSGHLLCYQLGVAHHLLAGGKLRPVEFLGCSGGAIVAAAAACLPDAHCGGLARFAHNFAVKGRAMEGLRASLPDNAAEAAGDRLHVGLTACEGDGIVGGTHFVRRRFSSRETLLRCVRASCHIPLSFHPFDLRHASAATYPSDEGYEVDGEFFVDGALSRAVPRLLDSDAPGGCKAPLVVLVTPASGPHVVSSARSIADASVRPDDETFRVGTARLAGLPCFLSLGNLQSLSIAAFGGDEAALRGAFDRGTDDAARWIDGGGLGGLD